MIGSILLIEDDVVTINYARPGLIQEGYTVVLSTPGIDAIRKTLVEAPDLVILGISSREEDWQFCRRLLTFLDRPLLVLLSTRNKLDRTKALELGADDCMLKPVLAVELAARARALLRRSDSLPSRRQQSFFVDGELMIDLTRREVRLNDQPVRLTPTEFRVLACLTKHVGELLPHDRILNQVWGSSDKGRRSSLKLYIHNLRQKLEADPARPRRILTRRGEGYILQRVARDQ